VYSVISGGTILLGSSRGGENKEEKICEKKSSRRGGRISGVREECGNFWEKIKQKGIDIPGEIAGKIRLCKCVL